MHVWDVRSRAEVAALRDLPGTILDVAFSPEGRHLAVALDDPVSVVQLWDLASQERVAVLSGHELGVYCLTFNDSGTQIASGGNDGTVRLWDTATWQELAVMKPGTKVYGLAFTPDGTRLAGGCVDGAIRLWDPRTSQEVTELRGHEAYVHQVAFSPDGTRLASASGDGTVRVWDTIQPQERAMSRRRE